MRTAIVLVLLAAILTTLPPPAVAQYSYLGLYSDPYGYDCNLIDAVPVIIELFAVLDGTSGALGVRFRVEQSHDCTLLYLQDMPEGLFVAGNVVDGLTICFGECVTGPERRVLTRITYFGFGTSAPCSNIQIKPIAPSTHVEVVSCDGTVHFANNFYMPVNDNGTCPCFVATAPDRSSPLPRGDDDNFCASVAIEESTWGAIKALYR